MLRIKYYAILLLSLTALVMLAGCATRAKPPQVVYFDPTPPSLEDQIRLHGAQIVQQGARLQLILPTDKFFRLQSTELKAEQTDTMDLIAVYLRNYLHHYPVAPLITVSGYTDTVFNKSQRLQLSKQYAQVIAAYLWNKGFSHQQLRVKSLAATHTIASSKTAQGSGYNRRVVIQVN